MQKLEKRGIIKGCKAIIDQEQRGLPISAFVNVTPLDYSAESSIPDKLNNIDGIVSCYSVAGAPSFVLVVRVASPTALEELLNLIHRTVPVSTDREPGNLRAEDLGPYGARFPTGTSDITQVHLYVHYMNAPSV